MLFKAWNCCIAYAYLLKVPVTSATSKVSIATIFQNYLGQEKHVHFQFLYQIIEFVEHA